jgi:hypothetical protein
MTTDDLIYRQRGGISDGETAVGVGCAEKSRMSRIVKLKRIALIIEERMSRGGGEDSEGYNETLLGVSHDEGEQGICVVI